MGNSKQMALKVIGKAMERENDQKALAMFDYMSLNFKTFREGIIGGQEYLNQSKKVWDGAKNVEQ